MAATACAYGYQGPLVPAARSSQQAPGTFIDAVVGDPASPAARPPPPAPPLPRPSKAHPPLLSHHIHLGICTEGLGSESSGDIDLSDLTDDVSVDDDHDDGVRQALPCKRQHRGDGDEEPGRARSARPAFPPPISVIGAGGKPWLYLQPHREDGRLVLREVRIPSCELLQARREDGRFKLQFAQPQNQTEDEEPAEIQHQQCQEPSTGNE